MAQVGVCGTDRRVACGAESVLHWVRWVTALFAAEGPLAGGKAWTWHAVWWGAGGLDRAWSTATQSRAKRDCAAKPPEEEREKGEETSEHFKSRTYWRSLGYNLFPWLKQVFKGLRSQCATNWHPFLLTKHALFHRIAMEIFCLVF